MKKLKEQRGFTLVEMLIVVAIIAVLVAVSIPVVNSSLNKAKQATDDANMRSAQAAAVLHYYNEINDPNSTAMFEPDNTTGTEDNANYCYASTGGTGSILPYSKAYPPTGSSVQYGKASGHEKHYIWLVIRQDGTVSAGWSAAAAGDGAGG